MQSLDLTRANVHNVHHLKDVKELFETAGIDLEVPIRSNQREQKPTM